MSDAILAALLSAGGVGVITAATGGMAMRLALTRLEAQRAADRERLVRIENALGVGERMSDPTFVRRAECALLEVGTQREIARVGSKVDALAESIGGVQDRVAGIDARVRIIEEGNA